MDGISNLSDAELINKTRDLESSIKRMKQNCVAMT
jgi:26S proteasome regulatory subunit T5